MKDGTERLRASLRNLPRHTASENFTHEVLSRLGSQRRDRRPSALVWAGTVAAFMVVVVLALDHARTRRDQEVTTRARKLLVRQQELSRQLKELRTRSRAEPSIPLSLGEDYDLVLAIGPWLVEPTPNREPALARDTHPPI